MTFASFEFAGLLAIVLGVYYFVPQRVRMLLLVLASYTFYCYWKPIYGVLIFASTLLDYSVALLLPRLETPLRRRLALAASVTGNLALLGYFKYTNFALDSLRSLLGPLGENLPGSVEIVLPIGISFYTFQTMSYAIDVFRGEKEPERDFVLVALYVSFFPQLVAGPIERAARLMPQLRTEQPFSFANLEAGGRLILWGLVKKLVVADRLAIAGYPPYFNPSLYSTGELAFGAASMFVVVYLDFSAYSDIAKGTAQLFGIRLVQNFRNPHAAGNIAEYWRRWHISMSDWVRDYLFRPLGGFRPRNLWHQSRTTLITMGLVGLWHGAQWTFVVWGLANGLSLVAYRTLRLYVLRRFRGRPFMKALPWRLGSWTLTNFVRIAISILFFAPSFGLAMAFYEGLYLDPTVQGFDRPYVLLGFAAIFAFWLFQHWRASGVPRERFDALPPWLRGLGYATLAYVVVLGGVSRADQFIYYQF